MATKYWEGTAPAVAQVSTIQITADDAATTYTVTIGGEAVSVSGAGTGVNDTATALQTALANSTHAYFTAVTWTVATDTVTGTAGTAGVPYTATPSVSGGTGTIGAFTTGTASSGPCDWSTAANWSDATVPVNADIVYIDGSVNICYGMAQSAVTLAELHIPKTYTGKIGLDYRKFVTSADGETSATTAYEYREHYLEIGATLCYIGDNPTGQNASGSQRVKIDFGTAATTCDILDTSSTSIDSNRDSIRILATNVGSIVNIRDGRGGVGVCSDEPGETSSIAKIVMTETAGSQTVSTGDGLTCITLEIHSGTSKIKAGATMTTANTYGGNTFLEGDFAVTTLNCYQGSTVYAANSTSGTDITTANVYGTLNGNNSGIARTWATVNLKKTGAIGRNSSITITTLNLSDDIDSLTAA